MFHSLPPPCRRGADWRDGFYTRARFTSARDAPPGRRRTTDVSRSLTMSRRSLVLMLSAFSLVGYVLRMNISVASPFMMTSLGLDKIQMGQEFSAFMLGYAVFQVPWGMSGDRIGPGPTLTWAAVVWVATTALTGFAPGRLVPAGVAS